MIPVLPLLKHCQIHREVLVNHSHGSPAKLGTHHVHTRLLPSSPAPSALSTGHWLPIGPIPAYLGPGSPLQVCHAVAPSCPEGRCRQQLPLPQFLTSSPSRTLVTPGREEPWNHSNCPRPCPPLLILLVLAISRPKRNTDCLCPWPGTACGLVTSGHH